jgi:hypothetical protein
LRHGKWRSGPHHCPYVPQEVVEMVERFDKTFHTLQNNLRHSIYWSSLSEIFAGSTTFCVGSVVNKLRHGNYRSRFYSTLCWLDNIMHRKCWSGPTTLFGSIGTPLGRALGAMLWTDTRCCPQFCSRDRTRCRAWGNARQSTNVALG